MVKRERKGRTERLLNIWLLLYQNPHFRFTAKDIAEKYGVDVRTIYRDLNALQNELGVPISEEGSKRGIEEGYFLPPIRFSLPEALNIFLSARLMLNYAQRYDPNTEATFFKLSSIVPPPLREQIQKTIDWMHKLPKDERYLRILARLAEAWVSRHKVKILYRALEAEQPTERIIEPYFIEPAAAGHSSYLIAYCHRTKSQRTFKIERIEAIEATSESYLIPPEFDANEFLGSSWGIVVEGEVKTVRLKINAHEIARIMAETVWHPSQIVEKQSDGSAIMTLRVTETVELYSWILKWGEKVEVLEPEELRQDIIETAKAVLEVYSEK
jgi:predicted DNA-binding transcriptional regulator YafY